MPFRIDRGTLRAPRRTPSGTLRVDGVITRAGVFEYRNPDGSIRRELRLPEDVFDAEALASFEGVPVTDDHPSAMVTPKTIRAHQRGVVQEGVRRDGDLMVASLLVTDPELVAKIEAGKRRLSCGYEIEEDCTPGVHPLFGRYDVRQRRIRGNHVAVVDAARAGDVASLRMDAAVERFDYVVQEGDQWCVYSESGEKLGTYPTEAEARERLRQIEAAKAAKNDALAPARERGTILAYGAMMEPKNLEDALKLIAALRDDAGAQKRRADVAEEALRAATARADKAEGAAETIDALRKERDDARAAARDGEAKDAEIAALKAERDDAVKAKLRAEDPATFTAAVAARAALEVQARKVLGDGFRFDGVTDRAVCAAALSKLGYPVDESRSDEYVRTKFETAVENYVSSEQALARAKDALRRDANAPAPAHDRYDRDGARQRMIERNRTPNGQR